MSDLQKNSIFTHHDNENFPETDNGLKKHLNNILKHTQILKQDKYLNKNHIKILNVIEQSAEYLLKDILHLSKTDAGKKEFDIKKPVKKPGTGKNNKKGKIVSYTHSTRELDRKIRILIVDDENTSRIFLRYILESKGFDIAEADSGHKAVEIAPGFKPDLILMDLIMPGLDGFETTKQIKKIPGFEDVIVIVVSADTMYDAKISSKGAGCHNFIEKPVMIEELLEKISKYLKIKWIHENERTAELKKELPEPPPGKELEELYKMAKKGDVLGIRKKAEELKSPESGFKAFGEKLYFFSINFLVDEMKQFIRQYKAG